MKTNFKLFYVIALMLAFLFVACSEENEPSNNDTEQPGDGNGGDNDEPMYFPPSGSDEWETTTPEKLGWNIGNFNEAIKYAKDNRSYNLLIVHRGKIVSENYWRGTTIDSLHDLNSVAKSFMAIVIGVLQQDGKLNIDDKVNDYVEAGWSLSPETEGDITIRQLMTMTSGLNDDLERIAAPGATWRYSHIAYKVLYDVIAKAGNDSYRELFDDIIFSKIGMDRFTWTGKDIATTSRPLARFGLMVMNGGTWNGEEIIHDQGYFADMLKSSQDTQAAYGYLWWLNGTDNWYDLTTKTQVNGSIASPMPDDGVLAKGKYDQRIYVVPSLDLVVVRQGAYTGLPEMGAGSFDEGFWTRLMKAINNGALEN